MWFRVDDSFLGHRKAHGLSNDSLATWTRAGEWCAWQLTDGVFDRAQLAEFAGDAADPEAVLRDLLRRNLWERGGEAGLVQFHDWSDWNPTREQVLAKRKTDAERRRRWLASRRDPATGRAGHGVTNHGVTPDHGVTDHGVTPDHGVTDHGVTGGSDAVEDAVGHGVAHTSPTRPDPTGSRVGEGNQGTDRRADDGWTPSAVLDRPPPTPRKRGGGPRTTHRTVADVIAESTHPGGPATDAQRTARADEARRRLAETGARMEARQAEARQIHEAAKTAAADPDDEEPWL